MCFDLQSVWIRLIGLNYRIFGFTIGFLQWGRRRGVKYGIPITYRRSCKNSMCKVLCTVSGVNHYLNSNQRKNLARTFPPIFYVLENFRRKFAKVVAPPTDRSAKYLVLCKHIWSSNRWQKQRQNRCIIGDAILPQISKKLTKKCGPEFGSLLWCHLTPHRKTAI